MNITREQYEADIHRAKADAWDEAVDNAEVLSGCIVYSPNRYRIGTTL